MDSCCNRSMSEWLDFCNHYDFFVQSAKFRSAHKAFQLHSNHAHDPITFRSDCQFHDVLNCMHNVWSGSEVMKLTQFEQVNIIITIVVTHLDYKARKLARCKVDFSYKLKVLNFSIMLKLKMLRNHGDKLQTWILVSSLVCNFTLFCNEHIS